MRTYLSLMALLAVWGVCFGLVAPWLISQKDTWLFIAGILVVVFTPIALLVIARSWWRSREGKKIVDGAKSIATKMLPVLLLAVLLGACSKVPAGNVGIIVDQYGGEKGVNEKVVGVGKYWLGWNEELFLFPTFTQTDVWGLETGPGKANQSITFQTGKDGMALNADMGITFRVDPEKVSKLFQTYRKGVDEISDLYLRNMVRDGMMEKAAAYNADEAYGIKRNEIVDAVEEMVRKEVALKGIIIEKVYLIGEIRLPKAVRAAMDEKNQAFQKTMQREQEVKQTQFEKADKKEAEARGQANSILAVARAQAQANKLINESITPDLVRYKALEKWDGQLPRMNGGGAVPFIDVTSDLNSTKK